MLNEFFRNYHKSRLLQRLKCAGKNIELGARVRFVYPSRITLGNHIYIGPDTELNGRGGITIADHAILAPQILVLSAEHRYSDATLLPYDQTVFLKPVIIERAVWIGTRATIFPGVTIGEGSVVGACSVVTRSVPAGAVVAGNPARKIGERPRDDLKALIRDGKFYLREKQLGNIKPHEVWLTDDK